MLYWRIPFWLFGVFIVNSLTLFAQEQTTELDPVTITSSLYPITASKTGRNIIVIKGEEISRLPVHSLDELLRYVPGIDVQSRGPMGAQSDIVLRGGTFQQVLIVLDGLRVNDPNTGHFSGYIPIAPAEIERIEIVKGASSAVYGSDAVGGVIQIITKSFARQRTTNKTFALQHASGEYALQTINAGGTYSKGNTAISAGLLSNNTDGQPQRGIRGFVHAHTLSLSLRQQLNEQWQISYHTAWDKRKFAAQNFYTTLLLDTADEKVETFWNQLRIAYQKEKNKFSINAGYKTVEDVFRLNPSSIANNNVSRLGQLMGVYEHDFSENLSLTTGGHFQIRCIHSNDRGNHRVNRGAAFVILHQYLGRLSFNPALRIEKDELSGTEIVPQVNISYKVQNVQLRGSAGKTIRNADFTEQYNNYNKPPFVRSGNRIGNPDLKMERSFSYEAGADWLTASVLKVSVSWFQKDYQKLIDWILTPYTEMPRKENLMQNGSFFLASNVANVHTKGIETDVQFLKQFQKDHRLYATTGFVWLHSTSKNAAPSLYVSSHARFLTNFSVLYNAPLFSMALNGLYKNRAAQSAAQNTSAIQAQLSKEYWIMNAKAELFLIKNKVSLFVQADNIWNKKYSDILGAAMPGRWWQGGLKVSLIK